MSQQMAPSRFKSLLLILGALFIFFFWTWKIPLWSSDEGRFAEIAREMLQTRNFVVPHFNYLEHFEKPVFSFFLTALSFGIFGVNALAARLPSILSALAGIFMTYYFAERHLGPRTALFSSIVLTTSVGYVLMGRVAMIDMLMTFFLSGSLYCLMTACLKQRPRLYLLSYVFMGLALITKGILGIALPALIFTAYLVWTRDWREIGRMRLGWGMLIIALCFIPWGIAISMQEPEFSYVFFWQHQITRFATEHFGRKRPFWFFIPIFFSLSFPWSFFLPQGAWLGLKEGSETKKAVQFLICWFLGVLLFFSLPASKLPYYILSLSMPVAILVGHLFMRWEALEKTAQKAPPGFRPTADLASLLLVLAILGVDLYLLFWAHDARALVVRPVVLGFSGICLGLGTASRLRCGNQRARCFFYSTSFLVYTFLITVIVSMYLLSPYFSSKDFARAILQESKKGDIIAEYASPDHFSDLPFYLGQRVMVVGSDRGSLTDESEESEHQEDASIWFQEAGAFKQRFSGGGPRVFCLLEDKKLPELERDGLGSYRVLKRDAGKLLISN